MYLTLAVTGALVGLSIITAIMTYRHIVRPLKRLEKVASSVSETKNYDLRTNENSTNEIGRLASAFDGMLAELASARDRERLEHSELARVARLTTAGVMTASIAHEIKQPLAAIVANGNAAQRWLSNASPDLVETRNALKHIIEDGHRVSRIIDSVRAMFKKDGSDKDSIDVNDLLENVLTLVHREIRRGGISVRANLLRDLPRVLADRTQLQQVFVNLTRNAVEALGPITDREKLLVIEAALQDPANVLVTVRDYGTGIDPEISIVFLTRSLRQSPMAWAWACPYAVRSSKAMADACGLRAANPTGRFSTLLFRPLKHELDRVLRLTIARVEAHWLSRSDAAAGS